MCAIFQDIQNNWIEFLSMTATVATMGAAFSALSSWKQQRQHETRIEIFSMSRRAMDLIKHLRNPLSHGGEMNKDLLKEWQEVYTKKMNPTEMSNIIFHSRLRYHEKTYNELLLLRERIWAEYEEEHIFNKYFDYIVKTIIDLAHYHQQLLVLNDHDSFPRSEYGEERRRLAFLVISRDKDEINTTLQSLFDKILAERRKIH